MPIDIAGNVLAARGQPGIIGNALARNQNLANARTNNALGQQSLRLNEEDNRRANVTAGQQGQVASRQAREYARAQVAQAMGAIANAQDPMTAARNITSNQQFLEYATQLGIDPSRFQMGPQVTPEIIKQAASVMAQELGGVTSQLENTNLPSDVRSNMYWNTLTPEQQQSELARRRALQLTDTGAGTEVVDPVTRTTTGPISPDATAQAISDRAASQAGAVTAATESARRTAEADATIMQKARNANGVLALLDIADPLIDAATGSGTGTGRDALMSFFGFASDGAQAIAQLQTLQAGLILSMPRLEGPQSDKDRQLYIQAAGQIGDPGIPAPIKRAAVSTIRQIQAAYGGGQQAPARAGGAGPEQTAQGPARITDDAGYDALPSGAQFIGPDGILRQKP